MNQAEPIKEMTFERLTELMTQNLDNTTQRIVTGIIQCCQGMGKSVIETADEVTMSLIGATLGNLPIQLMQTVPFASPECNQYRLHVDYRMTCDKQDLHRNQCSNPARKEGFYWRSATKEEREQELDLLNLGPSDSILYLQSKLEQVRIPEQCEAIEAKLTVILPGHAEVSGRLKRSVTFTYFRDFWEENQ